MPVIPRTVPYNPNKTIVPKHDFTGGVPKSSNIPAIQNLIEITGHENNAPDADSFNALNAEWANELRRNIVDALNAIGNVENIYINGVLYPSLGEAVKQLGLDILTNSIAAKILSTVYGIGVFKNRWDAIYGASIQNVDNFLPVGMFEILDVDPTLRTLIVESGTALCHALLAVIFRNVYDPDDFFSYAHRITVPDNAKNFNVFNGVDGAGAPTYDWNVPFLKLIPVDPTINKGIVEDIQTYSPALFTYLASIGLGGPGSKMIRVTHNGINDAGIVYKGLPVQDGATFVNATMMVGWIDDGTNNPVPTVSIGSKTYLDLNNVDAKRYVVEPDSGITGVTGVITLVRYLPSVATDPDDNTVGRVGALNLNTTPPYPNNITILVGTDINNLPLGAEAYLVYKRREPRIDLLQVGAYIDTNGVQQIGINVKAGISNTIIPDPDFNNVPLWSYRLNEYGDIVNYQTNRPFQDHPFYGLGNDFTDERRIIDTEFTRLINTRPITLAPVTIPAKTWTLMAEFAGDITTIPSGMAGTGYIRYRLHPIYHDNILSSPLNRINEWKIHLALAKNNGNLLTNPDIVMDFHLPEATYNVPGNFLFDPSLQSFMSLNFPIYDLTAPAAPPSYAAFISGVHNIVAIDNAGDGQLFHPRIDPAIMNNKETGIIVRGATWDGVNPVFENNLYHATCVLITQDESDLIQYGRFKQIDFSKPFEMFVNGPTNFVSFGTTVCDGLFTYVNQGSGTINTFDLDPDTGQITNAHANLQNKTAFAFYRVAVNLPIPAFFDPQNEPNKQYEDVSDFFEITDGTNLALIGRIENIFGTNPDPLPGTATFYNLVLEAYRVNGISDIAYGQNAYNENLYGY